MAEEQDWLPVGLDARHRSDLARAVEKLPDGQPGRTREHLLKVLRSSRDDLLLDREQAAVVLRAVTAEGHLPALKARLEAFLGRR